MVLWNNVFHQSLKYSIFDNRERLQIFDNHCRIVPICLLIALARGSFMSYTFCSCIAIVILGCTPGAVDLLVQGILSCARDTSRCFDKICFHILLVLWLVEHFKLPPDILVLQILHITKLLSPSDISKCFHTCDFILNVRNVNVLEFEGNNVNDSQRIAFSTPCFTPIYLSISQKST